MPNIRSLLNQTITRLQSTGSPTPQLDAEILLSHILKKSKEFIYSYPEFQPTKKQISDFQFLVSKRSKGEPIAYLTGHKQFYGLDFVVNKNVLIPRPETELLVEEVIRCFVNREPRTANRVLADIGTGSGCIAITLAKHLPRAKIYATDVTKKALTLAHQNAAVHRVSKQINFKHGDLLKPLTKIKIDVLVANLPYGWLAWKNNTSAESQGLKFEPKQALFTQEQGLKLYRQLFEQLTARRQRPKLIFIEFDPRQTVKLKALSKKFLPRYKQKIKKDLAGLNRILTLHN